MSHSCKLVSQRSSECSFQHFKSRYCANRVAQNKIYPFEKTSSHFIKPTKMKLLLTGDVHKDSYAEYEQQMHQ